MKRLYVVTYGGAEWDAKIGDIVELDLSSDDEAQLVGTGRLANADREYRVVGDAEVYGQTRGGTFEAALPFGQEQALVQGGAIEIVNRKTDVPTAKADTDDTKETSKGVK